jgi:hypothetical protein
MDLISYVYISWTIHGMWMIYITFEGGSPKFSNTTARALTYCTAVQQRQLRAKWLLCSTGFFAFVSSLKLSRWLLCSVRFVFVSTFNSQQGREFVVGITNLSKYLLKLVNESIFWITLYILVSVWNAKFNTAQWRHSGQYPFPYSVYVLLDMHIHLNILVTENAIPIIHVN